jgi:signal transduction histidine kinase
VAADPEELRRALANVLTNAFQSLGDPGASGNRVVVSTRAEGGEARITVTDSGPGFSPEAREHIFQLLYTSKSGGVGLGMSIVRDILRSLGGQVTIGDAPGGGAVVTLALPLAEGKQAAG